MYGIISALAEHLNGIAVCVARSGSYGDMALSVIAFIAIGILQRHAPLPELAVSGWYHGLIIALAIGAAAALLYFETPWSYPRWDNHFHSGVIVPIFMYLMLGIALPAIIYAGTRLEFSATVVLLAFYLGLVTLDFKVEPGMSAPRMNQHEWLKQKYGIEFPLKPKH